MIPEKIKRFKAATVLSYERTSRNLSFVFNGYVAKDFKVQPALARDIDICMNLISRLEKRVSSQHPKQKHRSFFQEEIAGLNSILQKTPLYIGVDFDEYARLPKKKDGTITEKIRQASQKVSKIQKKNRLPRLRFFPFAVDHGSNMHDRLDDRAIRNLLALGLFDYLERVITKHSLRPKTCVLCQKWFYAQKSNARFCSMYCRDRNFAKSHRGRERRRINTRNYRDKKRKEDKRYSSQNK